MSKIFSLKYIFFYIFWFKFETNFLFSYSLNNILKFICKYFCLLYCKYVINTRIKLTRNRLNREKHSLKFLHLATSRKIFHFSLSSISFVIFLFVLQLYCLETFKLIFAQIAINHPKKFSTQQTLCNRVHFLQFLFLYIL